MLARTMLCLVALSSCAPCSSVLAKEAPNDYLRDAYFATVDRDFAARDYLLENARQADPNDGRAHWLAGQIAVGDDWVGLHEAQQQAATDPRIARYREAKATAGNAYADHLNLARMCRRAGLTDEARYHWLAVLTATPEHPEALRALGLRWKNGQHVPMGELANNPAAIRAARKSTAEWKHRVRGWQRDLAGGDTARRDAVLEEMAALHDKHALPVIEEWTLANDPKSTATDAGFALVAALQNMSDEEATVSLVRHGLMASDEDLRTAAAEALADKSLYEFVPELLDLLANPVESNWQVTLGPTGNVRYQHQLFQQGARFDREVEVRDALLQVDARTPQQRLLPNSDRRMEQRLRQQADMETRNFAQRASAIESQVSSMNARITADNERIVTLLNYATGQELDDDPDAWWQWWSDYTATELPEERQVYETEYVDFEREYEQLVPPPSRCECFVAGTPVWTRTGLVPIEKLDIGDVVLSQDVETGELAYRPVLAHTIRKPSPAVRMSLGSEQIVATVGHPFWQAGQGWTMAKQLAGGEVLAGAVQPVVLDTIEPAGEQEAHNLVVEGFGTYFVGERGVLVHDGSPTEAPRHVLPGITTEVTQ